MYLSLNIITRPINTKSVDNALVILFTYFICSRNVNKLYL